jgi:hypothetical protein
LSLKGEIVVVDGGCLHHVKKRAATQEKATFIRPLVLVTFWNEATGKGEIVVVDGRLFKSAVDARGGVFYVTAPP